MKSRMSWHTVKLRIKKARESKTLISIYRVLQLALITSLNKLVSICRADVEKNNLSLYQKPVYIYSVYKC